MDALPLLTRAQAALQCLLQGVACSKGSAPAQQHAGRGGSHPSCRRGRLLRLLCLLCMLAKRQGVDLVIVLHKVRLQPRLDVLQTEIENLGVWGLGSRQAQNPNRAERGARRRRHLGGQHGHWVRQQACSLELGHAPPWPALLGAPAAGRALPRLGAKPEMPGGAGRRPGCTGGADGCVPRQGRQAAAA